jgi:nucleoside transporter
MNQKRMNQKGMKKGIRLRLSLMMLLQYFMFGSWLVTLGAYMSKGLGFDDVIGTAYGTQGIAALVASLVVGSLADRYFAAEKLLGVFAMLSGVTLLLLSTIESSRTLFLLTVLLHFMCFVPTISLTSTIALGAVADPSREFPSIRALGTVGWIIAGVVIGAIPGAGQSKLPLLVGGTAGLVLGLYSFTLPHTPPRAAGVPVSWRSLFGLDLVQNLRDRSFWTFVVTTLLMVVPLSFYNAYANNFLVEAQARVSVGGREFEPAAIQALGQGSEFVFLLLLPLLLVRFGIKGVLLIGMLAWSVRYALFVFGFNAMEGRTGLLIAGVLLHGICYDFFFVASQIYVEQRFNAAARSRAQALLVTMNMGVGVILGSNVANYVYVANTVTASEHDWNWIWSLPAVLALVVAMVFAALFRQRKSEVPDTDSSGTLGCLHHCDPQRRLE